MSDPDFDSDIDKLIKSKMKEISTSEAKSKSVAKSISTVKIENDNDYEAPYGMNSHYVSGGDLPIMLISTMGCAMTIAGLILAFVIILLKMI